MSDQQWQIIIKGRAPQTFYSPSAHTARNMAAQEATGRPFGLFPVCPACGDVINDDLEIDQNSRYVHPVCKTEARS